MFKKMNDKIKKYIFGVLFTLLTLIFLILLISIRDSKTIVEMKEFVKTDTKVIYITDGKKDSRYLTNILNKYEVNYLEFDSSKLSLFERKKIEKIVNSKYLNDIIVVYKNGKIQDALIEYKSEKKLNKFLQKNEIIPEVISDDVSKIKDDINKIFEEDYSMIYIPYESNDLIEEQEKIFKNISKKYSINYKRIDAYLLSYNQKEMLNQLLKLSYVEDQILILIKDKKMIGNIRGIHSKNTYVENLYDLNFINELDNKINEIDYDTFKVKLKSNEKSIILIGTDNSKDCQDVINILNGMIYNYNIDVNYINLEKNESTLYNKVKEKIENIGYEDGFTLPLVLIVESNNILDYIVGNTKEEYFIDNFIENGVIKGEIINE